MKPLIFIPSPRDIPEFASATKLLPYDKIWLKYYEEVVAYYNARNWFLDHEEYSHLIILPDDLIARWDISYLLDDIERHGYDVISGYCQNTIRKMWNYEGTPETEDTLDSNVSFILPPNPPMSGTYERYRFISMNEMAFFVENDNIIKIKYSGFAPTVISRKVVEQIPFRSMVCCVDSCFSLDLDKAGIDQYCDVRVETEHLELRQKGPADLQVGKKERKLIFEPVPTG